VPQKTKKSGWRVARICILAGRPIWEYSGRGFNGKRFNALGGQGEGHCIHRLGASRVGACSTIPPGSSFLQSRLYLSSGRRFNEGGDEPAAALYAQDGGLRGGARWGFRPIRPYKQSSPTSQSIACVSSLTQQAEVLGRASPTLGNLRFHT